MSTLYAVAIILWSMLAWASVFVVVPWVARSLLRYRLRRLRDDVYDGLRAGGFLEVRDRAHEALAYGAQLYGGQLWDGELGEIRLSDDRQPMLLLRDIELTIANVRDFSLMRMLALRWLIRRPVERVRHVFEPFDVDAAPAADREYLRAADLEFKTAIAKHVFLGTPMGFAVSCVFLPFAIFRAWKGRRPDDVRKLRAATRSIFREEVPLQPEETLVLLDPPDLSMRQPLIVG